MISLPVLAVVGVLVTVLLPLLVLGGAVRDLVGGRSWITVRCVLALAFNVWFHVAGAIALLGIWLLAGPHTGATERFARWNLRFEVWWANAVFGWAMRLFRMRLRVEHGEVAGPGPVILFPRHASILDVLLPVIIVGGQHGLHLRYVMKRELLWDPCIDSFGHREPTAFVRRGTRDHAPEIAAVGRLMRGLGPHDGVVLFVEGTRFTPQKQQRVLRSIQRKDPASYERARRLRHVLPPHLGGPLEVLARNDGADVVFCAHTGLEGANHFKDLLDGSLLDAEVRVRLWRVPAEEIPRDRLGRIKWLYDHWDRVDAWIDEHRVERTSR